MDLNTFMQNYAQEIKGQYSEYNQTISIIIMPLTDGRFQTVYGEKKMEKKYQKEIIEFRSKVCDYEDSVDLKMLLSEHANFCHAKFSLVDSEIQVEASLFIETATEHALKEAIQEVGNLADEYEFKLTGIDIN